MAETRLLTGTVAMIDVATGRPHVTVARRFGSGRTLGPCPILDGPTSTVAVGDHGAHAHGLTVAVGDTVLVAIIEDGRAVVLGRLS